MLHAAMRLHYQMFRTLGVLCASAEHQWLCGSCRRRLLPKCTPHSPMCSGKLAQQNLYGWAGDAPVSIGASICFRPASTACCYVSS